MSTANGSARFAICIKHDGYPASLEVRKIYRVLEDLFAEKVGQIRVIDESGEDYLYPRSFFLLVDLPAEVEEALLLAS
jgi:hypothetical protein